MRTGDSVMFVSHSMVSSLVFGQIAMEHVVQMSRDEYDAWLFGRVTLPP